MTAGVETTTSVRSVRSVGPDTHVASLETPVDFDCYPGQFVRLALTTGGERLEGYYTVSSAYVDSSLAVTFDTGADSTFGRALATRQNGELVDIAGPFGDAYYEGGRDVVVLAGGPGLGAAVGVCRRATSEGHDATLVYRCDRPDCLTQLRQLRQTSVTVSVVNTDSEPLTPAAREALERPATAGYVYGYSAFVTAATETVEDTDRAVEDLSVSNFG